MQKLWSNTEPVTGSRFLAVWPGALALLNLLAGKLWRSCGDCALTKKSGACAQHKGGWVPASTGMNCCATPKGRSAARPRHGTAALGRTFTTTPDPKSASPAFRKGNEARQPVALAAVEQHLSRCVESLELGSQHGARQELEESLAAHGRQLAAALSAGPCESAAPAS